LAAASMKTRPTSCSASISFSLPLRTSVTNQINPASHSGRASSDGRAGRQRRQHRDADFFDGVPDSVEVVVVPRGYFGSGAVSQAPAAASIASMPVRSADVSASIAARKFLAQSGRGQRLRPLPCARRTRFLSTALCAVPSRARHYVGMPVRLTVHDLKSLRVGDRLCSVAVGCLRLILGIKDQRDPSIFTGLKVETKAIWNHLDVINRNVHVESPSKNNNTDKRSIDRRIQFRYAVIAISMMTRAVTPATRSLIPVSWKTAVDITYSSGGYISSCALAASCAMHRNK
jgi:hypothetical protein